jgi:hypothetical protein
VTTPWPDDGFTPDGSWVLGGWTGSIFSPQWMWVASIRCSCGSTGTVAGAAVLCCAVVVVRFDWVKHEWFLRAGQGPD